MLRISPIDDYEKKGTVSQKRAQLPDISTPNCESNNGTKNLGANHTYKDFILSTFSLSLDFVAKAVHHKVT